YLDKAEQIIRRCTHPTEDVAALNLLDAENRWFYTMFLQALAKYLDHKIEMDELDGMYAFGRDVLLRYARWMADHERPYLDEPAILEFPTETWPAQDLRKSEIFDHAARHTCGAERRRFEERADFFFQHSLSTLAGLPTRSFARPVVLLLTHGFMHECVMQSPAAQAPQPREGWTRWARRERFVPQKARAKRRLSAMPAAVALSGLVVLARVVLALLSR